MADAPATIVDPPALIQATPHSPDMLDPVESPPKIIQRIYDTSAGWVQYSKTSFDPTPLASETTPNHTSNLVASTHQKLGVST